MGDGYDVGYGKPPKEHRFQSGQSGNPGGRPKKSGSTELDLDDVLDGEVVVQTPKGPKKLTSREVEFRQQVDKALKGNLRSIKYVLDQFAKYEAITPPASKILTGVQRLPIDELPFELSRHVFEYHGLPPWTKAQIAPFKEHYLETRTARQAEEDARLGYDL